MPRKPSESNTMWYERAIVANSSAADELEVMTTSHVDFNVNARARVFKQLTTAHDDLKAALDAYTHERSINTKVVRQA